MIDKAKATGLDCRFRRGLAHRGMERYTLVNADYFEGKK
jgi:hypothetical protein